MSAGLALCAVEIPGLHHLLVPGRTGVYARQPTPGALADAITAVLGDRDVACAMGDSARREARARFHPSVVAAATAELYHEVLATARRDGDPRARRVEARV